MQQSINESLFNTLGIALSPSSSAILWSVLVSCQSVGALVGCIMVMPLLNHFGVKSALMLVNNAILVTGSFLINQAVPVKKTMKFTFFCFWWAAFMFDVAPLLIIGRLCSGVFTGIACALLPLYVQQIAPKQIRGSLSCFMHIAVCFGSAVGAVLSLDFMLGGRDTWGYLLLVPGILGVLQIGADFVIPETPNYYLQNGSYIQAIQSIKFYYDIEYEDDDEAIREYWDMVPEMPAQIGFTEAVTNPSILKGIFLGMIVSASQIFCGSVASISYSTSMFSSVSFTEIFIPFLPALGSLISIAMTVPALRLKREEYHKANDLIVSDEWWASWLYLFSFFIFGVGYNLGAGPVAYFIPAELVPAEAASVSLGAAVAVNWISSMITTIVYYPLNQAMGGWSYLLFIIPTSVFLLILFAFLPETKFQYRSDLMDSRLIVDLGPPTPYGTFEDDEIDLF
ncbi:transporter, major facilitator family protein [Oesophagostomum dentatum]|uniref:Transporter, major facilitator family protein n=1 Tax=Oesophagostomum dentatum TaxID=61180 RepID=A0A0B1TT39_OESDE|nr:transporter, major facilitator family protein [Oesophagostomum dentatum]